MMTELKYPIGIESFEKLRKNGMVYVDKTELIHRLVKQPRSVFLSRPRRFGKSLLLSTIAAYFEGRRDLFEGLAIARYDHDWKRHPVFHVNFVNAYTHSEEGLEGILDVQLSAWEEMYGRNEVETTPAQRFFGVIERAVRRGMLQGLLPVFSGNDRTASDAFIGKFVAEVRRGEPERFLTRLKGFLADIPYDLSKDKPEVYFESNLYIIFRLAGLNVQTEYRTSRGRIDIVIKVDDYIYVMELKLRGSARKALEQINEKEYALPFAADGRRVFKIGISFSPRTRNLSRWEIEA